VILDGLPSVRSDGTVTAPCLALAKLDRKGIARLREEERNFNAKRNKSFGNPNYQLKCELEARLLALRGMTAGCPPTIGLDHFAVGISGSLTFTPGRKDGGDHSQLRSLAAPAR